MKKLSVAILSVIFCGWVLLGLTSCTREYTCQCEISYSGAPGLPDPDVREYSITDTKANAASICEGNSRTYHKNGITTVEDCALW